MTCCSGLTTPELQELEYRLSQALRGQEGQHVYARLVLRHAAAAARGPAMETDKKMYAEIMSSTAMAYPLACVEAFYRDWRFSAEGKWWPTESELTRGCEANMALWRLRHRRVYDALQKRQRASGVSIQP